MLAPDATLVIAHPTGRPNADRPAVHLVRRVHGRWRSLCGRAAAAWTIPPDRPRTEHEAVKRASCQLCCRRYQARHATSYRKD